MENLKHKIKTGSVALATIWNKISFSWTTKITNTKTEIKNKFKKAFNKWK